MLRKRGKKLLLTQAGMFMLDTERGKSKSHDLSTSFYLLFNSVMQQIVIDYLINVKDCARF